MIDPDPRRVRSTPTGDRLERGPAVRAAVVVYGVACVVHGAALVAAGNDLARCCVSPDGTEYLALSAAGLFNFYRTPGYPAFLWICNQLFGPSLSAVLWAHVFCISLIPALVAFLARLALPRFPGAAYAAGFLSTVSFTGLYLGRMVLTEAVFVPLVMAALVAMFIAARTGHAGMVLLSAALAGAAFLVRPIFLVWALFVPILAFCFGTPRRLSARAIVWGTVLAATVPAGWAAVNRAAYGVFTPSGITAGNQCAYWGGRTLATVAKPSGPTMREIEAQREKIWERARPLASEAEAFAFYRSCIAEILVQHPSAAWRAYWTSAFENLPQPFDLSQLGWRPSTSLRHRALARGLTWLNGLLYVLAVLGILRVVAARQAGFAVGLGAFFGAFWLLTATSYNQGSRLMYPAEPVLMLLAGLAVSRRAPLPAVRVSTIADAATPRHVDHLVSVLVPAHNEAARLEAVLDRVRRVQHPLALELVVVDDGSTDGTPNVLRGLAERDSRVRAFSHGENRGRGAALATAVARSRGDYLVMQDANEAYDPADHAALLQPLIDGRADAVFGSRYVGPSRNVLSFRQTVVHGLLTLVANILNDQNLSDLQAGLKVVRGDLLRSLALRAERDDFDAEIAAKLGRARARVCEVPIRFDPSASPRRQVSLASTLAVLLAAVRYRLLDRRIFLSDPAAADVARHSGAALQTWR